MNIPLIVISIALATQVSGANDNRYPARGDNQPAPPPGTASASASTTTTPISPPGNLPAATGGAAAAPPAAPAAPATGGGIYSPNRSSAFGGQLGASGGSTNAPTMNPSGLRPSSAQVQPPPSFSGQNGYSTANQAPSKSSLMMQAMLTAPLGSQLRGEPVRLIEVVGTGSTRNEQTQRIEAYWDLCSSVADYYLSVREEEELRKLSNVASGQTGALQEAAKKMGVRTNTSLLAARASQYRLANFVGRGPNSLPLPADLPHCGSYTSHYEQIFVGRSSPEAQVLAQLLPLRYAELDDAAISVSSSEGWLRDVVSRSQNSAAEGPVKALELLALHRRAFVQIARDYNRRIARYAELATPGQVSPDRLTGMLIRRSGASTNPTVRQSGGVDLPQRTFADTASNDNWLPMEKPSMDGAAKVDPEVKPASGTQPEEGTERSILLRSQ